MGTNQWVLILLLAISGVSHATQPEVTRVLDQFHQAASEANGEQYFALLHHDSVFIGTDASERWDKNTFEGYAMPYFSSGKGWTYHPRNRYISVSEDGQTAWFDELLDNDKYGECRGTGVLVNTDTGWQIKQYHLTIPLPNDIAQDVVALIKSHKQQEQQK